MPKALTAKGQSTRARIVQAAAELVAEKGAAAMSLDDVEAMARWACAQLLVIAPGEGFRPLTADLMNPTHQEAALEVGIADGRAAAPRRSPSA